ncbi:helix-turn-helix domain-containing protein [uncultured Sphingomonas sp.]|uniref:helix-turn-helix domain-containing protein n=1 Tax=uncultured Sphingomonas sp. TaxID=158754 RepID=UPI0035CAC632
MSRCTLAISIKDATRVLGVGRTTVYGFIGAGRLQTIKLGRRTLVSTASIRKLVDSATGF